MISEAGQRFGPYEILGRLGGGGMGVVLRAWDERLHRMVAIKLLHSDYRIPGMRERFLQEARAASALNHPHICTIFDIGEQDGVPYLVMELLEGETLKDRIGRGALPVEEIVRYGQEITEALIAAHAKGIVHRDIKPANIFLVAMPDGGIQAKVLDFGLAKIGLEALGGWESRSLDMTLDGATVGTLAYMSPEQARGESLDARSDLFSLGIVLYEMATRQVPFQGMSSGSITQGLLDDAPEPVRTWNESVPRELERVILKLLIKDRRARFQTAKELHESLARLAGKTGRGGWLNRGAATAAAVPLVRPIDPVARHKGPLRRPGVQDVAGGEALATSDSSRSGSSADNMMIRPVRMPERERDAAVVQPGGSVSPQTDSSAARALKRAEKRALDDGREPVLARSGSGAMQFEYGLEELAPQESKVKSSVYGVADEVSGEPTRLIRWGPGLAIFGAVILVAGIVFFVVQDGFLRPAVLGPKDRLLLTEIQNRTGDKELDGTVMQGMEIALQQTASLNVLDGEAYRAGLRQIAVSGDGSSVAGQKVAQKTGAKAYLTGDVSGGNGSPYTLRVSVMKTESDARMFGLEETAADKAKIPEAIARLAWRVRMKAHDSSARGNAIAEQAAAASLSALRAYTVGESAMMEGRVADALAAYQQAATLNPKFIRAQLRLAWLYKREKAEVAAARAAERARSAAEGAGEKERLLAQFCYEMNAIGDYTRATATIREYVTKYPDDAEGMKGLSRVLRMQGYLTEALLAAQQGYKENPFDPEMYVEAELAMNGLGREAGATQLQAQAQRLGLQQGYGVSAEQSKDSAATTSVSAQTTFAEMSERALALDQAGRLSEGLMLWRSAAERAKQVPEMTSARAYMLAQAALDRALVDSCTIALETVNEVKDLPKGPIASVNAGLAAALCGDKTYADKAVTEMQRSFPQNTMVAQLYVPELEAATELGVNEPQGALSILNGTRMHEQMSLIPYLRGLTHGRVNQMPSAVVDFQTVVTHRGVLILSAGTLYPMAQLGLARAYAASGDKADSVNAYRRLLEIWSDADKTQPGMSEALARSR